MGVGCVKPGSAYNYLGSSSWVALTVEKPIVDERMRTMNWAHCVPGYLHPSGSTQTACACLNWLKDTVCRAECAEAESTNRDILDLARALREVTTRITNLEETVNTLKAKTDEAYMGVITVRNRLDSVDTLMRDNVRQLWERVHAFDERWRATFVTTIEP